MPKERRAAAVELGRRVRERRNELGVTQMALADAAGMHFTYLSSVERGERNLSLENILRLSVALDVDAAVLVKGLLPSG